MKEETTDMTSALSPSPSPSPSPSRRDHPILIDEKCEKCENFSSFLDGIAYFGHYPSQAEVDHLESQLGVSVFVDLTCASECLPEYTTQPDTLRIRLPIPDMHVPPDPVRFAALVVYLDTLLDNGTGPGPGYRLYVHCRGGNGRSGMLVASLLCLRHKISTAEALGLTRHYHSRRPGLKDKYRDSGSPQTMRQKSFVARLFAVHTLPCRSTHVHKAPFVTSAPVSVSFNGNVYDTAAGALVENPDSLLEITHAKVREHPRLRAILLSTCLRHIIYSSSDLNMGIDRAGNGCNRYGRALMAVRRSLLLEYSSGDYGLTPPPAGGREAPAPAPAPRVPGG